MNFGCGHNSAELHFFCAALIVFVQLFLSSTKGELANQTGQCEHKCTNQSDHANKFCVYLYKTDGGNESDMRATNQQTSAHPGKVVPPSVHHHQSSISSKPPQPERQTNAWQRLPTSHRWPLSKREAPSATVGLLLFTRPDREREPDYVFNISTPLEQLNEFKFDPEKRTVIIITGWRSRATSKRWIYPLKDLILRRASYNVIIVDWTHYSERLCYGRSVKQLATVAKELLQAIDLLSNSFPAFEKHRLHLMGHSLGAHLAGMVGKLMKGNLSRITALDPAGPGFEQPINPDRLSSDDARFVVVEHSDGLFLGNKLNLGHVDIFMNGGYWQPGCEQVELEYGQALCAHRRSPQYAIIHMDKCTMMAYSCSSYEQYLNGECGFCEPISLNETNFDNNKLACHPAGREWQYKVVKNGSAPFEPSESGLSQSEAEIIKSKRFFVKTSSFKPYCLFTYQVVIKADEDLELDSGQPVVSGSIELFLTSLQHKEASVKVELSPKAKLKAVERKPLRELKVFSGFGQNFKTVSERNVITQLVHFDAHQAIYSKMPLRFTHAQLNGGFEALKGRISVYVNFMSHHLYEMRSSYSGPVEVRWISGSRALESDIPIVINQRSRSRALRKSLGFGRKKRTKPLIDAARSEAFRFPPTDRTSS